MPPTPNEQPPAGNQATNNKQASNKPTSKEKTSKEKTSEQEHNSAKTTIQVYYNSACPVCDAGITNQKAKMAGDDSDAAGNAACQVNWQDIHSQADAHQAVANDREFVRKRLHAVDENGQTQVGVDAFATIWRHSPGDAWKARLISLPIIRPCAQVAYNIVAWCLYRWNRWKNHW